MLVAEPDGVVAVNFTPGERRELDELLDQTQELSVETLSTVKSRSRWSALDLAWAAAYALLELVRVVGEGALWVAAGAGTRARAGLRYLGRYRPRRGQHRVRRSVLHMGRNLSTAEQVKLRREAARETSEEGDLPSFDDFVTWLELYLTRESRIAEVLHPLAHGPRHLTT